MTTREKAHRLLDELSEEELEAEYERLRAAVEREPADDRWGNLAAFRRTSSSSLYRRLDEEEAKAGFSWEKYR
jgi:hypothetical protein